MSPSADKLENPPRREPKNQALASNADGFRKKKAHRKVAFWWAFVALNLIDARHVMSQPSSLLTGETISIVYGYVTHHYLTKWEDRNLPAGVLRGLPPDFASMLADEPEARSASTQVGNDTAPSDLPERQPETEAAILYQLDFGDQGMQMMVSTKKGLRPGHCVALERRGEHSNLRRVSPAFCDPANQSVIESLEVIRIQQAEHCLQALSGIHNGATEVKSIDPLAEIKMLCDGG
tara:strand:+ start:1786 stop:2490 length:705 start_codon:yes stop_codon:yes gene_type:complete